MTRNMLCDSIKTDTKPKKKFPLHPFPGYQGCVRECECTGKVRTGWRKHAELFHN